MVKEKNGWRISFYPSSWMQCLEVPPSNQIIPFCWGIIRPPPEHFMLRLYIITRPLRATARTLFKTTASLIFNSPGRPENILGGKGPGLSSWVTRIAFNTNVSKRRHAELGNKPRGMTTARYIDGPWSTGQTTAGILAQEVTL